MQFQVPQFIETEDKIVGPFTLRQFLYLAAAGGLIFVLYFLVQTWLFSILSFFIGGAGVALAFLKINGRPFQKMLISAVSYLWKPQTYVWRADRPSIKKEEVIKSAGLEDIVSGALLKSMWQKLQVGTKEAGKEAVRRVRAAEERYQIFQKLSGERRAARRVDYR